MRFNFIKRALRSLGYCHWISQGKSQSWLLSFCFQCCQCLEPFLHLSTSALGSTCTIILTLKKQLFVHRINKKITFDFTAFTLICVELMPELPCPFRKICFNNSGTLLSSAKVTEAALNFNVSMYDTWNMNVSAYEKLCLVLDLVVSVQINFAINIFNFLHGLRKDQAEICSWNKLTITHVLK